tara:strand:+ start:580 stop:717 length:138 start_codon:yes stop_codon:yes gene_type:complete
MLVKDKYIPADWIEKNSIFTIHVNLFKGVLSITMIDYIFKTHLSI